MGLTSKKEKSGQIYPAKNEIKPGEVEKGSPEARSGEMQCEG